MKLLAATALTSIALGSLALPAAAEMSPFEEAMYDYGFSYGWVSGLCYVYQKGQVSTQTAITHLKAMEMLADTSDKIKSQVWANIRENPKATKCARLLDNLEEEITKAKYSL